MNHNMQLGGELTNLLEDFADTLMHALDELVNGRGMQFGGVFA